MISTVVPIAVAMLCYFLIPGAGALSDHKRWQHFRDYILDLSRSRTGRVVFFGRIEALEGARHARIIELNTDAKAALVDMGEAFVYTLVDEEPIGYLVSERWKDMMAIPRGAQIMITGSVDPQPGEPVGADPFPVIAVFFTGDYRSFFERFLAASRARNEYWNHLTPWSLLAGLIVSLTIALQDLRVDSPRHALVAFTIALAPLVACLPPGIFSLLAFRYAWRRIRLIRAQNDLYAYDPLSHAKPSFVNRNPILYYLAALSLFFVGFFANYAILIPCLLYITGQSSDTFF